MPKYCAKCMSVKDVDYKNVGWGKCNQCGKDTAVVVTTDFVMDMPDVFKDIFGDGIGVKK